MSLSTLAPGPPCSDETMLELDMEHLGLELKVEPGARGPKRCDPEARPESKLAVL